MTTAPARVESTPARTALRGSFESTDRAGEPAWLAAARAEALARFEARGFPTRKDEDWKATDLRSLETRAFAPAGPDAARAAAEADRHRLDGAAMITLSNGRVVAADPLPAGVTARRLDEALAAEGGDGPLRDALAADDRTSDALTDLNAALFADALVLEVDAGAAPGRPIQVVHVASPDGGDAPHAAFPRVLVVIGEASRATLVETWASAGDAETFVDAVVDVRVGATARLDHVVHGDEGAAALRIGRHLARVGRDATYTSHVVTSGGGRVRNGLHVVLTESGAHAELLGLYALGGEQQVDNHTVIDHAVAHTTSREMYKGVLDGRSRGTFFGRIVVRPDAQQISSDQRNDNLLLSDDALAHSTPQLEIYADDVQCRHGSTVGQIEGDALFYLQTRGVPLAAARELLTYAFANEIVEALPVPALRDRLARRLTSAPDAAPETA